MIFEEVLPRKQRKYLQKVQNIVALQNGGTYDWNVTVTEICVSLPHHPKCLAWADGTDRSLMRVSGTEILLCNLPSPVIGMHLSVLTLKVVLSEHLISNCSGQGRITGKRFTLPTQTTKKKWTKYMKQHFSNPGREAVQNRDL